MHSKCKLRPQLNLQYAKFWFGFRSSKQTQHCSLGWRAIWATCGFGWFCWALMSMFRSRRPWKSELTRFKLCYAYMLDCLASSYCARLALATAGFRAGGPLARATGWRSGAAAFSLYRPSRIDEISLSVKLSCHIKGSSSSTWKILIKLKSVWTQCSYRPPPQLHDISPPIYTLYFFYLASSIVNLVGPFSFTKKNLEVLTLS